MLLPTPALKLVMTKSSNESANAIIAPAATAGAMSGSVMWRNAPHADAPRSRAASSSCGSSDDRPRPDDDRHVRDAERDVGDRDLGERPVSAEQLPEEQQQAMPMTISGVTIGSRRSISIGAAAAVLEPRQPKPQQRPEHAEATTAIAATWSVTHSAPRMSSFGNSVGYQSSVKPGPVEVPPVRVEREDDQDDDGQEQEDIDDERVGRSASAIPTRPHQDRTSVRRLRIATNVPTIVTAIRMNPSAAPYGQSRPDRNSVWTSFATSSSAPRRAGPA